MQVHRSLPPPRWRWLVLIPALGCFSCSGSAGLHPVQGKLLYKNQPMNGAVVTFHPKGANEVTTIRPVGLVKEDGSFTLATGQKEGAAAGEYTVTVIWPEEVAPKGKKGFTTEGPETQDRLRGSYAQQATSTLKVEIKKGSNQLEPFHLK